MHSSRPAIQTLDDLRNYVTAVLCQHHQLEIGAFQLSERLLIRGNEPCGIDFCLHGPRLVKLSAIWEAEHHTILFYDSSGERFRKVQLEGAELAPSLLAAVDAGSKRVAMT